MPFTSFEKDIVGRECDFNYWFLYTKLPDLVPDLCLTKVWRTWFLSPINVKVRQQCKSFVTRIFGYWEVPWCVFFFLFFFNTGCLLIQEEKLVWYRDLLGTETNQRITRARWKLWFNYSSSAVTNELNTSELEMWQPCTLNKCYLWKFVAAPLILPKSFT